MSNRHPRTQIREAVAASLDGLATTRRNVTTNQLDPTRRGERAEIVIRTPTDMMDQDAAVMGANETRNLTIMIEGRIQSSPDTYEAELDEIAAEVKDRIFETEYLAGKFQVLYHLSDELEYDGEGERAAGIVRMAFFGIYRISVLDPYTLLEI